RPSVAKRTELPMIWVSNALRGSNWAAAYSLCARVGARMTIQATLATRSNVPVCQCIGIYLRKLPNGSFDAACYPLVIAGHSRHAAHVQMMITLARAESAGLSGGYTC